MKFITAIILLVFLWACADRPGMGNGTSRQDTLTKHDTVYIHPQESNWQEGFDLIHDPDEDSIWFKPVSYYVNDRDCSGLAVDFYFGILRPSDNGTTDELLKLAMTDNNKLRPFYRWCLNKTIVIQDGALAEHTGVPARKYAEKFPEEFFAYMDTDTTGGKYNDWVAAIEYSGFYNHEDDRKPAELRQHMIHAMKNRCKNCGPNTIARMKRFAEDCFR